MSDPITGGDPFGGVEPVAIVGMACRVPGSADLGQLWRNLTTGARARVELRREQMLRAGASPDQIDDPDYVAAAYPLDDVAGFDAGLFGLTPREAAIADPQHRLFLELCHCALEHAGVDPARFPGDVGVYGGRGLDAYRWRHVQANRAVAEVSDNTTIGNGNHPDTLTTLVSYRLGLRGPSVGVYTACSTSLVAVHLAAEALRAGECDLALAGGVNIELDAQRGYLHREGGQESADGYARPFDAAATGTVGGSGGGVVALRRLSDATSDGDHIHAVIIGNAVNNDGMAKVGFTAASLTGQAAAVANALASAGVAPRTIGYVETSATGSPVGDAVEVAALASVFRGDSDERQWCALGSVKANVGHLSQAAGVIGLIKTSLCLGHALIPPVAGFDTANPELELADSPFYVNATLVTWPAGAWPRRAGVSSFGIGGTNAHVVLEQAPPVAPGPNDARPHLLTVSARSEPACAAAAEHLAEHLAAPGAPDLADVAHTLRVGRVEYPHRTAVVAADHAGAVAALRARRRPSGVALAPPRVVFLFPGQTQPRAGVGRQLYAGEPAFAQAFDRCAEVLTGSGLAGELPAGEPPALVSQFVLGYALAALWGSWGVRPDDMIGHAAGEYVAATLAGIFELPDVLRLVVHHGLLLDASPPVAALAVSAPPDRLDLPEGLVLAARNGPNMCVACGPPHAVDEFAAFLSARQVKVRRLPSYPHHLDSHTSGAIQRQFAMMVAATRPSAPRKALMSGRTGAPMTAAQAGDPSYWARLLSEPVRFDDCVARAAAGGTGTATLFLECGPGGLAGLARMQASPDAVAHSLPGPGDTGGELASIYAAAARLWVRGVSLHPAGLAAGCRRTPHRVPLPGYPYERTRHWIDPDPVPEPVVAAPVATSTATAASSVDSLLWVPTWRRLPPLVAPGVPPAVVLMGHGSTGRDLAAHMRAAGARVVTVRPGSGYARVGEDSYRIRATTARHYARLVAELGAGPWHWVHAWALVPTAPGPDAFGRAAATGLASVGHLVQALTSPSPNAPISVDVITHGTQEVVGGDVTVPEHAGLAALATAAPAGIRLRHLDIDTVSAVVVAELGSAGVPATVALRSGYRWARQLDPIDPGSAGAPATNRTGAVYLLSGDAHLAAAPHVVRLDPHADPTALRALKAGILREHGRLDAIVYSAGPNAGVAGAPSGAVAGIEMLRGVFGDLQLDLVALCAYGDGLDAAVTGAVFEAYAHSDHGWRAPVRSLAFAPGVVPWLPGGDLGPHVVVRGTGEPATAGTGDADSVAARLARIWSAILGTSQVEPADDFFDLGGNSLAAVQLIASVRKDFSVRLSMRTIFDGPTLASMAAAVTSLLAARG